MTGRGKVFVLGASRTGTTSLHKFLLDAGFRSVHYFMDEVLAVASRRGEERLNFEAFRQFVQESGFDAFSDYPTCLYFQELRQEFASSYFILSTRRDVRTWARSMTRFFRNREDVQEGIEHLSERYLLVNQRIREQYSDAPHFIEVCIDHDDDVISHELSGFLGLAQRINLRQLNWSVKPGCN